VRFSVSGQNPAEKALSEAVSNLHHQSEQLRQAVRSYTLSLRERGVSLDDVIRELRARLGTTLHTVSDEDALTSILRVDALVTIAIETYDGEPTTR
jgi:hypothetical protein